MLTPLLATKLFSPPLRPEAVRRPRLVTRLNAGLNRKLTLISAPAGFGKTTIASDWSSACERATAWLSLDDADNDPARFMTYLVAALQTISGDIGKDVLDALRSPQPPPMESFLTALINDIAGSREEILLVLDDYHLIDAKPIDEALVFLVSHMPPQMHLLVATREDPNLPLARLRARGQLTELRVADLRFTPDEAAGFLNQMMGLDLSAEEIAALEARTEGWIAGLQLAAISMQGQVDATDFIQSFTGSHCFVMDYLVEEVLHRQPENVQTFLLRTSILDRLSGSLCDALLRNPSTSGQDTLAHIEQVNLFIVPLDNQRRWFRYHHLFADLLRQRLHQSCTSLADDGVTVADLHNRASAWYADNGLLSEAFQHALAAENFERAATIAELAWPEIELSLHSSAWLGWVKALPDDLVQVRPVLCTGYAWALLDNGEIEAGEARLRHAEQWVDASTGKMEALEKKFGPMVVVDAEQFRGLPASITAAWAYVSAIIGDVTATEDYSRQALALISEDNHLQRGMITSLSGCAQMTLGNLAAAHQAMLDGKESMQRGDSKLFATTMYIGLGGLEGAQGRLQDAVSTYQRGIQRASELGAVGMPIKAYLHSELSILLCEQGDLDNARAHLMKSSAAGDAATFPDWPYRYHFARARLKEVEGDLAGSIEKLQEAERHYCRTAIPDIYPVAAKMARTWLRQGRLAKAQEWVNARGLSVDDELSYLHEFEHITLARVCLGAYRSTQTDRDLLKAKALLERLRIAAEVGGRKGNLIEVLILQALALQAQGEMSLALAPLERALTLAEPEGFVRVFVDEGRPMAGLLSECRAHGVMSAYVGKLLAAFESEVQTTADQPCPPAPQPLVEPLSKRELEVLGLIAQGLSNTDIGERLFLALSTVKGHNRNIFGKLAVQRRTEAVARARELGLLPS